MFKVYTISGEIKTIEKADYYEVYENIVSFYTKRTNNIKAFDDDCGIYIPVNQILFMEKH
jgi:hypothetical protein